MLDVRQQDLVIFYSTLEQLLLSYMYTPQSSSWVIIYNMQLAIIISVSNSVSAS